MGLKLGKLDESRRALIGLLAEDPALAGGNEFDWGEKIDLLRQHGLLPLVYRRLKSERVGGVEGLEKLAPHYFQEAAELMMKYRAVGEVIDLLNRAEVDFLILKGPALGSCLYHDLSDRNFGDLDILVDKSRWGLVEEHLVADGYQLLDRAPGGGLGLTKDDILEHRHFAKAGSVNIEVQLDLLQLGLSYIDLRQVWERRRAVSIAGRGASILSNEDQLLHLLVHLNKHGFRRLIWAYDLFLLITTESIDWDRFARIVKGTKLEVFVYHSLRFLAALFPGLPVASGLWELIRPPRRKSVVWRLHWPKRQVTRFRGTHEGPLVFHKPIRLRWLLSNLILTGRTRDKLIYLGRKVLPEKEFLRRKLDRHDERRYLHLYMARIRARRKRARPIQ